MHSRLESRRKTDESHITIFDEPIFLSVLYIISSSTKEQGRRVSLFLFSLLIHCSKIFCAHPLSRCDCLLSETPASYRALLSLMF